MIVVEIQLQIDEHKRHTWPVYVTTLWAIHEAPVTLLVLTSSRRVARWSRRSIEIGHPGFVLRPVVVSYADVPRITNRADAAKAPELAVLSAVAHRDRATAGAAMAAIRTLAGDIATLYSDVIVAALPEEVRMIKGYQYQSELVRKWVAEGRTKGLAEGRIATLQDVVLAVVRVRLGDVSPADDARIRAITDPERLERLHVAVVEADGAAGVRAVIDDLASSNSH